MAMHSQECLVSVNGPPQMWPAHSSSVLAQSTLHDVGNGMQQAFTYLDELVKEVEKCEVMSCELRKLCDRLGVRCEQQTIEETFNKIYKLFSEYQEMAESERRQRNEADAFCQQIQKRLNQTEEEREKGVSLIQQKEQQLSHQTELVNKLEMNFRLAQEQIQNMKDSLTKELNEAKKNTTEARKAHIDAETQAVQLEQARRQAEAACQQALAALDQQLTGCQRLAQENQHLKQHAVQLEQDKRQAEENFDEFCKAVEGICVDGDGLQALAVLAKKKRELTAEPPIKAASVTTLTDQTPIDPTNTPDQDDGSLHTESFLIHNSEHKNLSKRLFLPRPSRGKASASALNSTHMSLQCQTHRSHGSVSSNDDVCPERWRARRYSDPTNRLQGRTCLPPSVVSGPSMFGQRPHARNHGQRMFVGWSPVPSDLVINSESSDSATAEDLALTGSYRTHSYLSSATGVNSYDYGGSSTLGTTDDYESVNYDSVNGMDGMYQRHEQGDGVNLLQWVWQRRGKIVASLRSGVSNAAQNGVKIARNGWAWATLAAITAGGVGMKGGGLSISPSDFSDSENDNDLPDDYAQVNAFQG